MRATLTTVTAIGLMAIPATAYGHGVDIDVLSSRPDQVSGGDALVRVGHRGATRHACASRSTAPTSPRFERRDGALAGLVDGLRLGQRAQRATGATARAHLRLRNHPSPGRSSPARSSTRSCAGPTGSRRRPSASRSWTTRPGRACGCSPPDGTTGGRLEPRLRRPHRRRPPLPRDERHVQADAGRRLPAGRPDHDHDARRPHRRLRGPPRARHDQPVPLRHRDARDPAAGTGGSSTASTAASRSATTRAGCRRAPLYHDGLASGTRSRTPPAPAPTPTTTWCSAARPR